MATILTNSAQSRHNSGNNPVETNSPSSQKTSLSEPATKELVRLFKLLSDETRLRILFFLLENHELNVRALCDLLHQSQPAVSHHLALLRGDGLIECRREGKHNFYRILPKRFGQLTGMIFELLPGEESQLRFDDRVLSYSPIKADG